MQFLQMALPRNCPLFTETPTPSVSHHPALHRCRVLNWHKRWQGHCCVIGKPPAIQHVCVCELLHRVQLFATPWTVAHQAPLSMGLCRQEY